MPTPISEVVRTIVSLRQLQLQEAAQQLARQQGQVSAQSSFSSMLPGLDDPNALLPHLSQFAQTTGLPEDVLQTIVQHTPASSSYGPATQAALAGSLGALWLAAACRA
jgi:transcription initiation factor TFIID subunit TAF12